MDSLILVTRKENCKSNNFPKERCKNTNFVSTFIVRPNLVVKTPEFRSSSAVISLVSSQPSGR